MSAAKVSEPLRPNASVSESLSAFLSQSSPLLYEVDELQYHARFYRAAAWQQEQPLLLYLHGYKNNLHSFADLVPRLHHPGVALDLRGFGRSYAPEPAYISLPDYLQDIKRLLDRLEASQVIIIGHSLGARAGAVFAALYPERVQRLVMLEGFYQLHGYSDWLDRLKRWLDESTEAPRGRPRVDAERLTRFFQRQTPGMPEALAEYLGQHSFALDEEGEPVSDWQEWHNRLTPISFSDAHMLDAVNRLTCPTLAIQSIETPPGYVELPHQNAQVRLEYLNAGHQIHWDKPVEVANLIAAWLAQ